MLISVQVPAKPNYSMVMYYAADRPVNKNSLLGKFVDGSDLYRDSRFKLIPSIVEVWNLDILYFLFLMTLQLMVSLIQQGYWMVKRAVGTKACLLGKAVTCKYLRRDNFLEVNYSNPSLVACIDKQVQFLLEIFYGYLEGPS